MMAKTGDAVKRELWRGRLERFEASGLSVAQFCRDEGVGSHTFYYWSKQLGRTSGRNNRSRTRRKHDPRKLATKEDSSADEAPAANTVVPVVEFRWNSQLSFSIPASCLDAIRCVLACAGEMEPRDGQDEEAVTTFRQVILS